ncbi:MAG TPA: hypothetical protein VFW87_05275 [Pirellulales bacterium]|nr:hypothetical protein [Pirellulales bacterium]
MEVLELAIARKRVSDYSDKATQPEDTDECHDCKSRIEDGIEAYHWLRRAEETIREAVYQGLIAHAIYESSVLPAIANLYVAWLQPFEQIEALADGQSNGEGKAANPAEFRECRESVRDWLQRQEWLTAVKRSRNAAMQVEPW